jgi:hypothetical protein
LFEVKNRRLSEARFWERAVAVGLVCKGFIVEVVDLGVDKEAGSHDALLGNCLEGPSDFEGGLRNLSPLFSGWFFDPGTLYALMRPAACTRRRKDIGLTSMLY